MKRKQFLFCAAAALVGMAAVSCEGEYKINDTQINTAVRMQADGITATDAVIELSPTREVASYIIAGPVLSGTFNFAGSDAITSLNWIQENGQEVEAPYSRNLEGLVPETGYLMGFVARDAQGTIVSAPSFGTFTTKAIGLTVKAVCEGDAAPFTYSWSIEPNEFTPSFKYIVSSDPAVVNAEDAQIEAKIKAGGADVKTSKVAVSDTYTKNTKDEYVVAAVPFDKVGRAGKAVILKVYTDDVVSVMCNGTATNLNQPVKDVLFFEGVVDLPASGTFTIAKNGMEYGYLSFSGNGGVGQLEAHPNMATPAQTFTVSTFKKQAYKAVGRMSEIEAGGNPFWTNMAKAGKVKVTADFTAEDEIPRYRLDIVETDPNVVLRENFELFVAGGYYWAGGKGDVPAPGYDNNDASTMDGTEPVIMDKVGYTDGGSNMLNDPEVTIISEGVIPCEAYIRNRDLAGWSYERVYEHALAVRVGKSSNAYITTYLTTPALSKLAAGSTITADVILSRMGGGTDPVSVAVIGSGTITDASYSIHNAGSSVSAKDKIVNGEFRADGTVCPKVANADKDKPITTVTLTISGAGPDTRISTYPCKENSGISNSRFYCHGITITKK